MLQPAPTPEGAWGNNIALLEHININTDEPEHACDFFVEGLGFVRDRRMGICVGGSLYMHRLLWVNAGINQVHLPLTHRGYGGAPRNTWDGTIGLVYESPAELDALCERLVSLEPKLGRGATQFGWGRLAGGRFDGGVEVRDPMGNRYVALATAHPSLPEGAGGVDVRGAQPSASSRTRSRCLGIAFICVPCAEGRAPGIARYFEHYFGARAAVVGPGNAAPSAVVRCGPAQELRFEETKLGGVGTRAVPYELAAGGIHIALYLYEHGRALRRLGEASLLWPNPRFGEDDERAGAAQFRCKDIVALTAADETGDTPPLLHELELEVRSFRHPGSPFRQRVTAELEPELQPVNALVSTVTDAHEEDWATQRAQNMANKVGYLPPLDA